MTQIEFAILDTTISYVEEQIWSFKKQLINSVTSVFDYDTSMRIAMSHYEIGTQPRIYLDDIFMSVLISVNETMYKYNF